jgi:ATP-dependent Clp protease ATP-binding subunit ClpA
MARQKIKKLAGYFQEKFNKHNMKESSQTAKKVIQAINNHISKGGHSGLGVANLLSVGDKADIKNLGAVLKRPGISLNTVCRVVEAIKEINPESSESLNFELSEAFAS